MRIDLQKKAEKIRKDIIKLAPTPDNLGAVEILTALIGSIKHNPRKPDWQERDRVFVTNKIWLAWRTTLAHTGYFAKKQLLQNEEQEIHGELNIAVGSALAARMDGKPHRTYCVLADEDHNKGTTWEAILIAGAKKLNNITAIIDRNNIQTNGYTENILPLEPLRAKYEAFNWNVIEVDGHDVQHIIEAIQEAKTTVKPTAIIAHTTPGKGMKELENKWTQ